MVVVVDEPDHGVDTLQRHVHLALSWYLTGNADSGCHSNDQDDAEQEGWDILAYPHSLPLLTQLFIHFFSSIRSVLPRYSSSLLR